MADKIIKYDDTVVYENGEWIDSAYQTIYVEGGEDEQNTTLIATLSENTIQAPLTINDQLTRIENAKAEIISAIKAKGVDVPEGTLLSDMASYIAAISDANYKLTKSEDGTTIILQKTDEETEQSSVTDNDTVPETISDTELNTILAN